MARHKDTDWSLPSPKVETWEQVGIAVLMDIRDELQQLNRLLGCQNFTNIPRTLRVIARNTARYRCRQCHRTFESGRGVDQHARKAHAE